MNAMNRREFEADLLRQGYEVREGEIEPNVPREAHVHGFDARVFVLDGSITLVFGEDAGHVRAGRLLRRPGRHHA
jgi:hypothetical protein